MDSGVVALASAIATAATAIVGFWVQLVVARGRRDAQRREARYGEMAAIYDEAAEHLSWMETAVGFVLPGVTYSTEEEDEAYIRRTWQLYHLLLITVQASRS